MNPGRKRQKLTERETQIMQILWEHGPLFIREMVEMWDEPKPHFNTISTLVRILEEKKYVGHEKIGNSHRFYAIAEKSDFSRCSLAEVIRNYFNNSYKNAVSALAEDEKISIEELREIIDIVESRHREINNSK
ncbi:MAG: BlaI/MecI/CopY family transcriptional regulator [Muribaculaceae bacterium]|nr:BlaI/MecI/CopY family transcriptional regulator [Muribaculaceae bacterium]MDE5934823.1 BlaI/MecI/CopY family transcriptional regulator [Muribaculaceae bacterium]MDE6093942.1 BlaI/MecI/CopY family transcriptional regulator [Muribaculaceae bacterium]MDE6343407.1 BlaI/MecI/CopY family transcriptional regulator [Muribaculaceae bacterium]MDE6609401.1 BlaI/MecI/CopY family transcriptional regulator [Muribaculaceae bacterium]